MDDNPALKLKRYRRDRPRISAELPVEIALEDGSVLHAQTLNVSLAGLQIVCDSVLVARILPEGLQVLPARPAPLSIALRLPAAEHHGRRIEAHCQAVFVRRVAEREYRVGLQFASFEGEGGRALEAFVDDCLAHA